ncbi:hypothetical protein [Pseudomonas fulva]|uniref:hypothetical protein n=1 Tax=Pseudomonas fulva TaxID=47880 RepID=UPI001E51CE9F|nr:hypothetical protein [Pseudomonas fulva]
MVVRGDVQTGQDSTEGLNRDVSKAYEITRDDEERTDLYVTKSSVEAAAAVAQAAAEKVAREVQAQRVKVEEIPQSARTSLGDKRALAMAKNLARNGLDPELMKGLSPKTLEHLVTWADSAENYNKVYEPGVGANTSSEPARQSSGGGTIYVRETKIDDASRTGGEAFLRETADIREYLGTLPVAEAQLVLLGMQVFMGPAKAAVSLAGNVLINAAFGDKIDAIKENAAVGMTAGLRDEDKKYVQEEHDYAKQQYAAGEDGYLDGDGGVLASRFLIELAAGEIGALTKKVAGKAVGVVSGGPQGSGPGAKATGGAAGKVDDVVAPSSKPEWLQRLDAGNEFNKVQSKNYPNNEVYIQRPDGNGYYRVDSYNPIKGEIVSRKLTQLSEVSEATAKSYINEAITKYPSGATIAKVPSSGSLGGQKLQGTVILEVPPQNGVIPKAILDSANKAGVLIRDTNGKVY